ncbi:MAG TPA: hypothetical protein VM844_01260 [Miltoncostaeaceae bacterium]|nr:hypothetical protein [Miltoncostaeaceae bacterium]
MADFGWSIIDGPVEHRRGCARGEVAWRWVISRPHSARREVVVALCESTAAAALAGSVSAHPAVVPALESRGRTLVVEELEKEDPAGVLGRQRARGARRAARGATAARGCPAARDGVGSPRPDPDGGAL